MLDNFLLIITNQPNYYIVGEQYYPYVPGSETVILKDPIVARIKDNKLICESFEGCEDIVTFSIRSHVAVGKLKKELYPQIEKYIEIRNQLKSGKTIAEITEDANIKTEEIVV